MYMDVFIAGPAGVLIVSWDHVLAWISLRCLIYDPDRFGHVGF